MKNFKKVVSLLAALGVMVSSAAAFAAAPSAYDGQPYENVGLTSDDPDGEINLAVISKSDITLGNTMYIKGSVYSNGTISVIDGAGNTVEGLFISGTGNTTYSAANEADFTSYEAVGYKIVDSDGNENTSTAYDSKPNYAGAVYDDSTSYECSYTPYTVPEISNKVSGTTTANQWGEKITVSEDTYYESLAISGDSFTIDATNNDVNIVIGTYDSSSDGYFTVLGNNKVNIYIGSLIKYGASSNQIKLYTQKEENAINNCSSIWWCSDDDQMKSDLESVNGDADITFYIDCDDSYDNIDLQGTRASANIVTNKGIDTNSSTYIIGDFTVGGQFSMTASTLIWGTVCAPNSTTYIGQSATLYGQLHTDSLDMSGAGAIIYQADSAVSKSEATPAPTEEPETTPAPLPDGTPINLKGVRYAYIFGYEPKITVDEDGQEIVEIEMAPDDSVKREEVSAMLMRLLDQEYDTKSVKYPVSSRIAAHEGTWYERGFAYLDSKGAFDNQDSVSTGAVTRGEVAKLLCYALNLSETGDVTYGDTADSQYAEYINIVSTAGYMEGTGAGNFEPARVMTRAEFCSLINSVTDRDGYELVTEDGTVITPATYYIVDLDGHWGEDDMLKATSAFNANGKVDLETRNSNIRNSLDNYDSQLKY